MLFSEDAQHCLHHVASSLDISTTFLVMLATLSFHIGELTAFPRGRVALMHHMHTRFECIGLYLKQGARSFRSWKNPSAVNSYTINHVVESISPSQPYITSPTFSTITLVRHLVRLLPHVRNTRHEQEPPCQPRLAPRIKTSWLVQHHYTTPLYVHRLCSVHI